MNNMEKTPANKNYFTLSIYWFKKNYLAIIVILAVIALSVLLYIYRDIVEEVLVEKFGNNGYLGASLISFLISLVSSLTIVLPVPGFLLLLSLTSIFNPIVIALAASTGGIIGELSGYIAGRSGRSMLQGNKSYLRAESWMKRWGTWAILLFAFVPLVPFDVAGLVSGALRFPVWKFMIAGWVGKSLKFIILLYLSAWGFQLIPKLFGG
jgi:membrane protein YqaA with SNARE-associated domain